MSGRRKKRSSKLTPGAAIQQVAQCSRIVKACKRVKDHQRKRIVGAFELLHDMHPKKTTRTERYRDFYKLAYEEGGQELVVAIAVAGGVAKFANINESERDQFVTSLACENGIYKLDMFTKLAEECSKKGKKLLLLSWLIT